MPQTFFQTALYAALLLCALGLLWRMAAWYRVRIGPDVQAVKLWQRLSALLRGTAAALFGRRVFQVLGAFFLDVLLQRRLYRSDKFRWLAHLLILVGFMLLLLMHALAPVVTARLFSGYESTRAPYLFLRNLFGAMVVFGLALFLVGVWRRRGRMASTRRPMAWAFVVLLGLVLVTGFLLEAAKIASPQAFYRMARQYRVTDAAELEPLRAFWASEFAVAFDDLKYPIAADMLRKGRQMHDDNCADCHARAASAFVSYPLARMLAPMARSLDQAHAPTWLLYLHLLACFIGLATLPFTRFFHAVAAPISLLVHGAAPSGAFSSAARAARRALALDACVQCGICDAHCSVAPLARHLGNPYLLPSHKLIATAALASGRLLPSGDKADGASDEALRVAEGAFLCTDCARCTSECPVGLDLEDLWQAGRGDLAAAGLPAPAQWVQARPALAWAESLQPDAWPHSVLDPDAASAPLSSDRSSFSRCVQCQSCTNVCPVVAHSTDPAYGVDLTPQNVMNLLRLGLRDLTLGSRMVWACAGCYQCQEHCPQGLRVADIMLELRALAVQRLGAVRNRRTPT
jgi:heterodisulfide reductase subunit C/nitrate reductase gamma subunit